MEIVVRRSTNFGSWVEEIFTSDMDGVQGKLTRALTDSQKLRGTTLFADQDAEIWGDGELRRRVTKTDDVPAIVAEILL